MGLSWKLTLAPDAIELRPGVLRQCTHTVGLCVLVHLVRQIIAQAVFEGEL